MVIHREYTLGLEHWVNGDIDPADSFVAVLLADTYTPALDTDEFLADIISHEIAAGGGYTAGGQALTSVAVATVLAASVTAWQASTAYVKGDIVRKTVSDGNIYYCAVAGTTGGSEPTWVTTRYRETADNTVVWLNVGGAYVSLGADNPAWPNSDITAAYLAFGKDGTADVDDYLLSVIDFEGNRSSENAGNFEALLHATGLLVRFRG